MQISAFELECFFNRFCSRGVSEARIRSAVFQRRDPGSILAICQTLEVASPSANPTSMLKTWNEKNVSTVFLFLTRTLDPALDVGTVPDPGGVYILYLLMHLFLQVGSRILHLHGLHYVFIHIFKPNWKQGYQRRVRFYLFLQIWTFCSRWMNNHA